MRTCNNIYIKCPNCNHDITDYVERIEAISSIRKTIERNDRLLTELENKRRNDNELDLSNISGWCKILPYIILGAVGIASLIFQSV
jgi:hypothetical protein